jgi:glycosyltransferase involved in cell wall biosynthesis
MTENSVTQFYKDSVSIVLTVYNQEELIWLVFRGITDNMSENVKEIIVVIDGSTDNSEKILYDLALDVDIPVHFIYTPNVNETKANNEGLRLAKYHYAIIVQDDCIIKEKDFDKRLLKPFKQVENVLAVSGRNSEDAYPGSDGKIRYYNRAGQHEGTPRNIFAIRDSINRGPLMLDKEKLEQLNYLDEDFAPLWGDDADLAMRGYKEFGYIVGSFWIDFESQTKWGTTRKRPKSYQLFCESYNKNTRMLIKRHGEYLSEEKHSKDVEIE